jgi:phospholipid/cholesterol/gamma-HCH transport system substrate-binding protein
MKFHQNKKNIEFRVGFFSIIAILILAISYSWFTGVMENRKYTTVKVHFENAGNLEIGSDVTINGVKKGRVKNLQVSSDGVVVHLLVELDFPMREGTEFYILESNLMGDVLIEIIPGKGKGILDLEEIQTGEKSYGLTKLVVELSEVVNSLESMMNGIYDNDGFLQNLRAVVDTSLVIVSKINSSYNRNSKEVEKLIANTSAISENLARLISENEENVTETITQTADVVKEIKATLTEMEKASSNIQAITEKILLEDNSLNKLITEKELYENLLNATANLDSLLKDIKKNPKKYLKIKVF